MASEGGPLTPATCQNCEDCGLKPITQGARELPSVMDSQELAGGLRDERSEGGAKGIPVMLVGTQVIMFSEGINLVSIILFGLETPRE